MSKQYTIKQYEQIAYSIKQDTINDIRLKEV